MKKGIEFADETWNPVWGCENKCPYCFARSIAKRFGKVIAFKEGRYRIMDNCLDTSYILDVDDLFDRLNNFKPTFLQSHAQKKFKKKSTHILVNSMSDIMYWKPIWFECVMEQIKKYPDKKFIFFTKDRFISHVDLYNAMYHFRGNIIFIL